jgi:hypothetical protein
MPLRKGLGENEMSLRRRAYLGESALAKLTPGKFSVVMLTPGGQEDVVKEFDSENEADALFRKVLKRWNGEKIRTRWHLYLFNNRSGRGNAELMLGKSGR